MPKHGKGDAGDAEQAEFKLVGSDDEFGIESDAGSDDSQDSVITTKTKSSKALTATPSKRGHRRGESIGTGSPPAKGSTVGARVGAADGPKSQRGKDGIGSPKKKILKKKAVPPEQQCFAARCVEKKKKGGKCCPTHMKDLEAMRYQAEKKGQSESRYMKKLEEDSVKLDGALADFARLNPPGKFRKSLIDWTQFSKKFGVTQNHTMRQSEEEYTWDDWLDEKTGRGWLREIQRSTCRSRFRYRRWPLSHVEFCFRNLKFACCTRCLQ